MSEVKSALNISNQLHIALETRSTTEDFFFLLTHEAQQKLWFISTTQHSKIAPYDTPLV